MKVVRVMLLLVIGWLLHAIAAPRPDPVIDILSELQAVPPPCYHGMLFVDVAEQPNRLLVASPLPAPLPVGGHTGGPRGLSLASVEGRGAGEWTLVSRASGRSRAR